MARECHYCGKKPFYGNNVSHSNRRTRTRWLPNLRSLKAVISGTTQTIKACTRCIRSGKVVRPLKRTFTTPSAAASK